MSPPGALLALVAFCSAVVTSLAVAPNGNCELLFKDEPVSEGSWTGFFNVSASVGDLQDTAPAELVYLELTTENVVSFTEESSKYVEVRLDPNTNTYSLVVTEAFANYEKDMIDTPNPRIIDIPTELTCEDGATQSFKFKITVEDVNTHKPEFDQPSYEYPLPMPFPSDIDLSCIVGEITVQDLDFSNTDITILLSGDGDKLFTATATYDASRNYKVQLRSKTAIELNSTTSFDMTAQDSGTPQLISDTVTITITVNEETSLPTVPRFDEAAYHETVATEKIAAGNEITRVKISEGYGEDVVVGFYTMDDNELTPPMDSFVVEPIADGNGAADVIVSWAEGVTTAGIQDFKYALIVVKATRDRDSSVSQEATTVIHLSLPGLEQPTTTACPTSPATTEPTEVPTTEPCPPCSTTAEPTHCPEPEPCSTSPVSPTDSTWWPTTQCPECTCSPTTEQCNCQTSTDGPPVDTTSPGSTNDCSQCPVTECPTSPSSDSSTASNTGSTNDCSQCPVTECPTSPSSDSSTASNTGPTTDNECPNTCPTSSPTSPNTGSSSDCPISCDDCPTAAPTTTTTALPPGPDIEFEKTRYGYNVASGYSGELPELLTLNDYVSDGQTLNCQLDATNNVASSVSVKAVDTTACQLTLDVFLSPGSYTFNVVASLEGTSSTATAEVALGVEATVPCDDSNVFGYALLVKEALEGSTEPQSILSSVSHGEGCTVNSIVDPEANTEWVQVNQTTGEVTVSDLDYEKVTSLVISLSIECTAARQRQQLWSAPRDLFSKEQPNWPQDILFNTDSMTLLLLIQDINDNAPQFTDGDRLVLGYPTGDLLERVQPGPVVTLQATDADEGKNAELRYSLDANGGDYFTVQPETGTVYLRADVQDLPEGGVSCIATVQDLAGEEGALKDTITLQVKPLDRDELVLVVTVEDALPEDADTVVDDLSKATALTVRLLRAYSAVSESATTALATRAGSATKALTLLMCALDAEESLVTVEQFQTLLSSSEGSLTWTVSKIEMLPPDAEDQEPTDVTGYLIGIIVLAVLIIVAAVAMGASYYFYFRPRMGARKEKDGYTEFPSDSDKPSPLESQIPQITTTVEPNISTISEIIVPVNQQTAENNIKIHEDSNGILAPGAEDDWQRKRSMTIRGGPDDYNTNEASGGSRRSESSDSIDGDDAQDESERRKSTVHFNEKVECIEVERL